MNETKIMKIYNCILARIEKVLGNKSTTTSQLNKIGKELLEDKYLGTFPIDFASKIIPNMTGGDCIITNLDTSKQSGSHWVAIVKTKQGDDIVIYDSFGRNTKTIISKKYLSHGKSIQTDNDKEQNFLEENCGQRSLAFLLFNDLYGIENAMLI